MEITLSGQCEGEAKHRKDEWDAIIRMAEEVESGDVTAPEY